MEKVENFVLRSQFDTFWELPPEKNASDYVLRKTKEHAESGRNVCVRNATTDEYLEYVDVEGISGKIASKLRKLGLEDGDTVIYSTHDSAKVHCFLLGVWRANGVMRSCYPEDTGDILVERILESKVKFLACDPHTLKEYKEAAASVKEWNVQVILFGDGNYEDWTDDECLSINEFYEDDGSELPICNRKLSDIALILPTSGTTGHSKGAIYTHKTVLENVMAFEKMPFTDKDEEPTIVTSRQTHFVGSVVALSFFTRGRYLLTMPSVTVDALLEAVDKYKARAIVGFPKYLIGLVTNPMADRYDCSSLHFLAAAGEVIKPEMLKLLKTLPNFKHFINLYGMTEAGLLVTSVDWAAVKNGACKAIEPNDSRNCTVGKLPPNTSLQVLDIDTGVPMGPNCKGEMCFKTPVMIAGYLNRPQDEAETFLDGWVKTGDIGYYDEDGFIYIVDRAKEIFKYYNNHISPSEIESVLLRHPSVAEAVVVGVPDPEGGGSIPRGFVVFKSGKSVDKKELILFTKNNLPPYKQLHGGLFVLPHLPVGKTGKITRKLFSEMTNVLKL